MRSARVLLAVLAGLLVAGLSSVATAAPVDDAISTLRCASLYVQPDLPAPVTVDSGLSLPPEVKIAVVNQSQGSALSIVNRIGSTLDPSQSAGIVVAVFAVSVTGGEVHGEFRAKAPGFSAGYADQQAAAAIAAHKTELQRGDLAPALTEFANTMRSGPPSTDLCTSAAKKGSNGGGSTWPWVLGLGVVGAGGIGALVVVNRRGTKRKLTAARANVQGYYERLANEINTLDPKDNDVARQSLADAAERFTAAGGMLAQADSVEEYAAARRTVLEGLHAAKAVRAALGLDPGPEVPPVDEHAGQPQLTAPQEVAVQGQQYQGYPSYTPGAPYYYGGGSGVPGGWYQTPFWETLILGSVLSGGFGGGSGYDDGYRAGYEKSQEERPHDTWSGGGGGDSWSGGGGGDSWGGGGGSDSGGGGNSF